MSTKNSVIIKVSLLAVTICLSLGQVAALPPRPVPQGLIARAQQITGDNFPVTTRTPQGVTILARKMPRREVLRAIDQGFNDLFAVARRNGYRTRLSHNDYTIFIARPDRVRDSGGQYSPDIAVGASQYAGSVYDQGGFIYAAGMVLAFNPSAFVIAEHEQDFGRIANVVRYEGEHLVLYYNNRALYERTADHSRGGSHPILQ